MYKHNKDRELRYGNNEYDHLKIKHRFDMEYSTQLRMEKYWLDDHGFECSFIRRDEADGILVTTYKYKKTPELFAELARFYELKKEYDRQRRDEGKTHGPCDVLRQYESYRWVDDDSGEKHED